MDKKQIKELIIFGAPSSFQILEGEDGIKEIWLLESSNFGIHLGSNNCANRFMVIREVEVNGNARTQQEEFFTTAPFVATTKLEIIDAPEPEAKNDSF
jgi:hypothetical protein